MAKFIVKYALNIEVEAEDQDAAYLLGWEYLDKNLTKEAEREALFLEVIEA